MPELSTDIMRQVFRNALVGQVKIKFDDIAMAKRGRKRLLDFRRNMKDLMERDSYYDVLVSINITVVTLKLRKADSITNSMLKAIKGKA